MFGLAAQAGLSLAGLGLGIYGTMEQMKYAKELANEESSIAGLEQNQEAIKYTAMVTDARRRKLENIRNAQRARAQAVSTAVNQGAGVGGNNYGSGLPGGEAQIAADVATANKGIDNQINFSSQMFQTNSQIYGIRAQEARTKADMAEAQGYSALGGSLMSAAPTFGKLLNFGIG